MAFAERTETKTTLLPLLHKQVGNDELKPPPAGSAMTKKGAYAAVSYMASAGSSFSLSPSMFLCCFRIYSTFGILHGN
ncbi:UDP-sugar transporter sqv-7-like isoform X2 [Cucumis melo var. makuwa]|uniref:UDP-sugar transporter sqv-7-like isoform X2 n=1 Tax=Cucumis melo var. makuwa TaxID=1194695 RepID=A0A5A7V971_CUCMM|nr:UDP-sugar transporter sqv-7-like isoform X2 [Cucumis melo var. makuwa]TYJ97854.1 UDP-sugar transporter sqv-7-like isoform X2 [Cucumis melo var. makuwa]